MLYAEKKRIKHDNIIQVYFYNFSLFVLYRPEPNDVRQVVPEKPWTVANRDDVLHCLSQPELTPHIGALLPVYTAAQIFADRRWAKTEMWRGYQDENKLVTLSSPENTDHCENSLLLYTEEGAKAIAIWSPPVRRYFLVYSAFGSEGWFIGTRTA